MTAQPQKRTELLEALQGMLEPTRIERGCLSYSLYESVEDRNVLLLVEEWKTQDDLDRHIRTDGQKRLLSLMDLLSKPPQWKFNTVLSTAGMELIKKVLSTPGA
jgi:quinol monooxygenase YgiN